jgi:hypothetical protein
MQPWHGYAAAFAGSVRCGGLLSSGALAVFWRFCSLSFVKANVLLLFESNDKNTYNARFNETQRTKTPTFYHFSTVFK